MDGSWFSDVAEVLGRDRATEVLNGLVPLLGHDATLASWRRGPEGWAHDSGSSVEIPDDAPAGPGVHAEGTRAVALVGDDPTTTRLFLLQAPALDAATVRSVAQLLAVAVGRLVEVESASGARQRLADNERIGGLGSYDWHVPTDTNRWSDQLFRIYGEEPQSFNASYERFMEFIHPDDRDKVTAIHQAAFATGEPYEMEERIVLADGTERLLWSNGEVISGPDGSPEHFIGICRDVTDVRAAERAAGDVEQHRQQAHDAEIRRRAALELNDVVVQGLTSALWATEVGAGAVARQVLEQTLEDARRMMDDLLVSGGAAPAAGQLRRTSAPASHMSPDSAMPRPPAADVTEDGHRPTRVVLADDAPDIRFLLALQLGRMGLEVVGEAENGQEAIDLVAEHAPDVVLLDLSMPVMDGLEAARVIRDRHPELTIVVVSGYGADTMSEAALAAGADAYVEKGEDLEGRLGSVLGLTTA